MAIMVVLYCEENLVVKHVVAKVKAASGLEVLKIHHDGVAKCEIFLATCNSAKCKK